LPSDARIGHRAIVFASLCEGDSEIKNLSRGADIAATANAMCALGAEIDEVDATTLRITGKGIFGLRAPRAVLECDASRPTIVLLAGILAAQTFETTLTGDASILGEPMMRVVAPLRARGAIVEGRPHPTIAGELTAPLTVGPLPTGTELTELEYASPVASAKVKSALLLSGMYAHGTTWFREPTLSPDHTERLMHALGVPLRAVGTAVELDPAGWSGKMPGLSIAVPGDISAAAYLLVAAQITEGSRVTVRHAGVNPTRTGLLEIARHLGAGLEVVPQGDQAGEPVAEISAWHQPLRGMLVGGELVPRAIEEIPIACVLATRAVGATTIRDAYDLRGKAALIAMLRAFGVACEELPDGLVVHGKTGPFTPALVESRGDPRIAMAGAVLALHGSGPTRITDCDSIARAFPRFVGTLRALGARIEVE
jgi:3-phosphoshikimate 1-carboxyvinyltransferase